MSTIHLDLPEPIRQFVDEQVANEGLGGPEEHIQSILRDVQVRKAQEHLEAALLRGLDSPARELRSEEWADMRREALQRVAHRTS